MATIYDSTIIEDDYVLQDTDTMGVSSGGQQFLIVGDMADVFGLNGDVNHGCDVFMWQSGGTSQEPNTDPATMGGEEITIGGETITIQGAS